MNYREERDTLGIVKVPADKYWGAQTERSRQNFAIGEERMPIEMIYSFVIVKKSAAIVNHELGKLQEIKKNYIVKAADEILSGKLNEHFPLVVWQTGSGTQTNMNVNEVIAYRANQLASEDGKSLTIHPNDDVNMSQSSNDTFPTAMHIAAIEAIEKRLLPAIRTMKEEISKKKTRFDDIIKIGRTHLQDATPLTVGQELSGWVTMLLKTEKMVMESKNYLLELAIGGTAVGTGINAHPKFGKLVCEKIAEFTDHEFVSAPNKFHALTSHDEIVHVHGAIKALAADVMKIANDIRWLASGPRAGLAEFLIPANEPGSSIMPGKVNPTQSEALTMIVSQVFGNDATIGFAASQGNFQLNVFKPVIIYNFLQSVRLVSDGLESFTKNCIEGLGVNKEVIKKNLMNSLMLVTALNPHIGYEKAATIAKLAYQENISLKEAAIQSGLLTEEEFDSFVNPANMVEPKE
ncbi:class II fumarate hydratase [Cytobacillus suaedae]|nr:class II fumarate hydratase [Cytobacillus suaedae]